MNREQAKIWSKLSKAELRAIGRSDLSKCYEALIHFAAGGHVEYQAAGEWRVALNPNFKSGAKFRIKPKTHIVNGFEVPAPIKKYTGQKTVYFPSFSAQAWCAQAISKYRIGKLIARRIAFETPEAARANSMAMLGIDPSTYKEQSE